MGLLKRLGKILKSSLVLAFAVLGSWGSAYAAEQVFTSSPASFSVYEGTAGIEMTISYDTDPTGQSTTGAGIALFFDSTKLTFVSMTALHDDDLIGITDTPIDVMADNADEDADSTTDKKLLIAYQSFSSAFPGSAVDLPVALFQLVFDAASDTFVGDTSVNFVIETAIGYTAVAPSVEITFVIVDTDGDGYGDNL